MDHRSATEPVREPALQSLLMDDFLYFFLRLRKQRVRMVVQAVRGRCPDESREELAQRLISSHSSLAFLGGVLFHLPAVFPGVSSALKLLGLVGGTAALTRMHLYLILEIALLHGEDIDSQARVPEMVAVVAATGAAMATPLALIQALDLPAPLALPVAGLAATAVTRLVGLTALRHYAESPVQPLSPAPARA